MIIDQEILTRIENLQSKVADEPENNWLIGFLDSIYGAVNKYGSLTPGQLAAFEKQEVRNTPEYLEQANLFKEKYKTEYRAKAIVIAKIYQAVNESNNTEWWSGMINSILEKEDYVPSEFNYEKFACSKFAEGYYKAYTEKPKFANGAVVCMKKSSFDSRDKSRSFRSAIVIVSDHEMPTSHARGAKKYLLMPIGGTASCTLEERQIKKYNIKREQV